MSLYDVFPPESPRDVLWLAFMLANVAGTVMFVYAVPHRRAVAPAVQAFGPWMIATNCGLALLGWVSGQPADAAAGVLLATAWAVGWWRTRPPRPPKRAWANVPHPES